MPVFQKEPAANRTVCYCFGISESDLRREIDQVGSSTAAEITALVKADRCAGEVGSHRDLGKTRPLLTVGLGFDGDPP